jgi:hypothetical protein
MGDAPTPRAAPRCTAAERRIRAQQLAELIASGVAPAEAARECCRRWGLASRRAPARYLELVTERWARDRRMSARASFDVAVARRLALFRLAVGSDDLGTAARCLDAIERLQELVGRDDGFDRDALARLFDKVLAALRGSIADRATLVGALRAVETALGDSVPINRAFPFGN